MVSEHAEIWAGDFGNAYHARNRVNWRKRIPFWDKVMDVTGARSVLEIGCGPGWNLSAIKFNHPWVQLAGTEINRTAANQAMTAGLFITTVLPLAQRWELVFTAGVLIHVSPDKLGAQMQSVVNASCDYVLAVEYAAEAETEIDYRGQRGMLWKRPYGRMYEDMGLQMVAEGEAGEDDGFDSCTYWLLRKVDSCHPKSAEGQPFISLTP